MDKIITDNLDRIAARCEEHGVRQLDVFGSAARDDFDEATSDVDLLVKFLEDGPNTRYVARFFAFETSASAMLGRRVDLHSMFPPQQPSRIWEQISRDRMTIYEAPGLAKIA